jgi:hypothetical protein
MPPHGGAARSLARGAAVSLALAAAVAPPARAGAADLVPVSLETLGGRLEANAPTALTQRGLEIRVDGYALVVLPFAAQELELDAEADAPILLSWTSRSAGGLRPYGPPWRYATVPRTPAPLRLDLRIAQGWTPSAQPALLLKGTGTVVVHAMRARPAPREPAEARAALDRALLWAPESVGHTTINLLTPSYWSATRRVWLADVVAGAALSVFLAALAASRLRRGRLRPGPALAVAGLAALALWDAHFLVRFLPMANLRVEPDREARIRENYYFDPEFGALAALARETLGPGERVGTMGGPKDWFAPQTLCFDLAPRPCAIVRPGEAVHAGISRVGSLRPDEIDAIVSFHGGPLPDGFETVAAVTPRAVVARRR